MGWVLGPESGRAGWIKGAPALARNIRFPRKVPMRNFHKTIAVGWAREHQIVNIDQVLFNERKPKSISTPHSQAKRTAEFRSDGHHLTHDGRRGGPVLWAREVRTDHF